MLVAVVGSFGPGNTYSGRSVTWDEGVFTIEGLGETSLDALRESETAGQFAWASAETRAWAEGLANETLGAAADAQRTDADEAVPYAEPEAATPRATAQAPRAPFALKPWMAIAAIALLLVAGVAMALAMQPPRVVVDGPHVVEGPQVVGPVSVSNAPVTGEDSYTTAEDTPLTISAAEGVLANDTDPDGDALSVAKAVGPVHGKVMVAPDGGFTYTPPAGFSGSDYFTYAVSDGRGGTGSALANITVTPVRVVPPKVVYTKHAEIKTHVTTVMMPFTGPYGTMYSYRHTADFFASSGGAVVGSPSGAFDVSESEMKSGAVKKTSARSKKVDAIVSRMKKAGWTVTGKGSHWFSVKFGK